MLLLSASFSPLVCHPTRLFMFAVTGSPTRACCEAAGHGGDACEAMAAAAPDGCQTDARRIQTDARRIQTVARRLPDGWRLGAAHGNPRSRRVGAVQLMQIAAGRPVELPRTCCAAAGVMAKVLVPWPASPKPEQKMRRARVRRRRACGCGCEHHHGITASRRNHQLCTLGWTHSSRAFVVRRLFCAASCEPQPRRRAAVLFGPRISRWSRGEWQRAAVWARQAWRLMLHNNGGDAPPPCILRHVAICCRPLITAS
ncbi:hypothetical protein BDV95DRAFT_593897 [Massariosphaeria phaeospora]|uniref:Uncharacterized protein n=1 Tax=Massariosphaeria phaeospora TaxID=100035 RepID=A0A7C8MDB8_9PLEO|nr:hypothetical protein BDV95DRAFT_593897 [Massariosphaeria phaeospora]